MSKPYKIELLVPSINLSGIAGERQRSLADSSLCQRIVAAGRDRCMERFCFDFHPRAVYVEFQIMLDADLARVPS